MRPAPAPYRDDAVQALHRGFGRLDERRVCSRAGGVRDVDFRKVAGR